MAALTILLPENLSNAGPRESPLISSLPLLVPWAVILSYHKEYHQTDELVYSGEYMKWANWPGLRRIKQYLQHLEPSIQKRDTALSLSACYPSLAPSGATVFSLECDLTSNRSDDITNMKECNIIGQGCFHYLTITNNTRKHRDSSTAYMVTILFEPLVSPAKSP